MWVKTYSRASSLLGCGLSSSKSLCSDVVIILVLATRIVLALHMRGPPLGMGSASYEVFGNTFFGFMFQLCCRVPPHSERIVQEKTKISFVS